MYRENSKFFRGRDNRSERFRAKAMLRIDQEDVLMGRAGGVMVVDCPKDRFGEVNVMREGRIFLCDAGAPCDPYPEVVRPD